MTMRMLSEVGHPPLGPIPDGPATRARAAGTPVPERTGEPPGPVQEHHRHLSDLLHPFRDRDRK